MHATGVTKKQEPTKRPRGRLHVKGEKRWYEGRKDNNRTGRVICNRKMMSRVKEGVWRRITNNECL